jgi:hypothetical protein
MRGLSKTVASTVAIALSALVAPPAMAADPRAQDAVDVFIDYCVTDVLGLRPRVTDPSRFIVERVGKDPAYVFRFKASRAKVLANRGPKGSCAVQVLSADEADMQAAFLQAVERAAAERGARLDPAIEIEVAKGVPKLRVEKGMTKRSWVLRSEKATLVLSIATTPPNLAAEHIMTSAPAT